MGVAPALRRLLAPVTADPPNTGIFADFDGTLSEIVDDPSAAVPVEGLEAVLEALVQRYGRVGVISGRPVSFLTERLPVPGLVLAGLYGLEIMRDGQVTEHPSAGVWREAVADVVAAASGSGPPGMRTEPKGVSVTLHYRTRPEIADEVWSFARSQAQRSGLVARPARMSVELHPPVPLSKGTALAELTEGLSAVLFVGDDVGDLEAFDQLDDLERRGCAALRCAVRSDESPLELLERADIICNGPADVRELLEALLY